VPFSLIRSPTPPFPRSKRETEVSCASNPHPRLKHGWGFCFLSCRQSHHHPPFKFSAPVSAPYPAAPHFAPHRVYTSRGGVAAREAGGAATRASLAGTQPHSLPYDRARSLDDPTHQQISQKDGARVVRASPSKSRALLPRLPLNRPPRGLDSPGPTQRARAPQTTNKARPQRGLVLPRRPRNAGRRQTPRVNRPGPGASALYRVQTGRRSPIGRRGAPQNAQERRVGYVARTGQVE
jgi:hypothetical protein